MTTRSYLVALLGVIFVVASGCGKSSTEPQIPGDDGPIVVEPNPDGVLLEGEGTSPARDALDPLPPSAAGDGDVQDGFISTRLVAALAPGASVTAVNDALEAQGARIVSMNTGTPFVTLKIPAASGVAAAEVVADALRASGAFTYAAPAHAAGLTEVSAGRPARGGGPASEAPEHLERSRFIAAWNMRELAAVIDDEITVLVPDEYTSTLSSSEIDAQSFTGFGSPNPLPGPVIYPGNNGFVVSGVIGANVDETLPTGTNPYPADLLDIESIALGGFTWTDVFWTLAWEVATSGDRFVLNTGIGYNDPDYVVYSKLDRAMHVIAWRIAAALHYQKFVHVASAGSPDGDPELNSPFIAAALFDDVREMVDMEELSQADSLSLETAWQDVLDSFPLASAIAGNVITVAGADGTGALLSYSAPGDVRALGANVLGPCTNADPGGGVLCDGDVAAYSGTGVAAAQVTGLAAYLMNLGNASPAAVRGIISSTYAASQSGLIDAYDAVLRLDGGASGPVRETLLDVAGFESDESDGDFDDYDLPALSSLYPGGPVRSGGGGGGDPTDPFIRRFDLNGDGITGGFATARFDLDGNGSYGTVTQNADGNVLTFDENGVTDFDVVCYYAYSDLYNGDPDVRALYLVPAHSGIYVEIQELPERIPAGEPFEMTVTAGLVTARGGDPTGLIAIDIDIDVDNGYADPSSGEIEPGGTFTTMVTLDEDENELFVEAWAELGDEEVNATGSALRFDEVEFVTRYVFAGAEVFSTYCQDVGIPCQTIVQVPDFEILEDTTDLLDEMYMASGSGSGAGMQVMGEASATMVNNLDIGSTNFSGTTLEGSVDGTITLTNPNPDIHSYQAQAGGWVEVDIEFNVWGEPAPFALSGTVSGQYYDVDLDGDDQIFECDSSDEPCATISAGGLLEPGTYDLDLYVFAEGYIGSHEDTPHQGTQTESATIDVTFVVNHGGVRLPEVAPVLSQVTRRPLSPTVREMIDQRRRASVGARRTEPVVTSPSQVISSIIR